MDLRVLVVSPDQNSAELLGRILSEMGIQPEHTASFSQGLDRLEKQHFDAVILDYHENQASQEFLSRLHQSTRRSKQILIAIVDGEYSARPLFGLGANFVLYRPLSEERTRVSLRAARGMMRRERRLAPRIPVRTPASFAYPGAEDQKGTLTDLSDGGTKLQSWHPLPPSCKVYFQFSLPGQRQLVRLSGEVAWQDASGRVGIRFVDVPKASRRMMHDWLLSNNLRPAPAVAPATPPEQVVKTVLPTPDFKKLDNAGNRRGVRRVACTLGAEVYRLGDSVPNRCALSDLSEGGCYVEMPSPFAAQTGVEIVVRTVEMKVKIHGQVQSVHPGFGMGVRFMFRDSAEHEEVFQLLARLATGPSLDEMSR